MKGKLEIRKHLTVPNQLTILRMLMVPVVAAALGLQFPYHDQIAAVIYALAASTDTLDGQIARRRKQITQLGKFLDPLADKLLVLTVLVMLVSQQLLPFWVLVVIFLREFLITGLRTVAASQGVVIAATPWGKSKTATQNVMIMLLILQRPFPYLSTLAGITVVVAVVATLLSGFDYLWRYRRFIV